MPDADGRGRVSRDDLRRIAVSVPALLLILTLGLFLPAGTLAWTRGWLFLGVFLVTSVAASVVLWRVNPEIFHARSRFHEGTRRWDLVLLSVLLPLAFAIFPVAALDDGRFHWSRAPWWVCVLGYLLYLVGTGAFAWAQAVNRFFEPGVRIQTDRGHEVVDTGPYALVRHPGYVSGTLLFVGIALALGSYWAVVPVALCAMLLILRTRWEDQMLQAELPGYGEYAQRIRYKWIPGIW
jgi:protein-S-isoprenylcysteine O-methyltransferase Ste14